nr:uncharacterized protein LOC113818249 [Penaeus vannamei]
MCSKILIYLTESRADLAKDASSKNKDEGCEEEEKEDFWRDLRAELEEVEAGERMIIRGDLNGHIHINRDWLEREWWENNSGVIRAVGEEVLGKTSGKGPPENKESWWWNEEVQVNEKEEVKKKWEISGLEQDKDNYKQANKRAKMHWQEPRL